MNSCTGPAYVARPLFVSECEEEGFQSTPTPQMARCNIASVHNVRYQLGMCCTLTFFESVHNVSYQLGTTSTFTFFASAPSSEFTSAGRFKTAPLAMPLFCSALYGPTCSCSLCVVMTTLVGAAAAAVAADNGNRLLFLTGVPVETRLAIVET